MNKKIDEELSLIPHLDSTLFTWQVWRSGSVRDLDIKACRYKLLTSIDGKIKLRKYAIGWCYGYNLMCRPKVDEIAIMFEKKDNRFWFHLRREEFIKVFMIK